MDRHQRLAVAKRITAARLKKGIKTKREAADLTGVSYRQYAPSTDRARACWG